MLQTKCVPIFMKTCKNIQ